jgi:hypothetical protein
MSIRSTEVGGKTYYSAKQVFEMLGLKYKGYTSSSEVSSGFQYIAIPTKVGDHEQHIDQYAVDESGLKELCKRSKKSAASLFGFKTKSYSADKEVAAMQKTVDDLKNVVAQLLTKDQPKVKSSTKKQKSVTIKVNDPLQIEARKQIRELVQDYASKRADELGITEGEPRRIFYDLSFKALYNAYKLSTKNKLDLKALADAETEKTGVKTSGLVIAERLGIAIELLKFTKSFYN